MPGEGGGYLRGLVTGALVGAATALLLAPKRGEDIRQDLADSAGRLKEKAEDLTGHLSDTAHDLKERGSHLVENVRDRSGDFIAQADEKVEDRNTEASGVKKELKNQAHDVVESV